MALNIFVLALQVWPLASQGRAILFAHCFVILRQVKRLSLVSSYQSYKKLLSINGNSFTVVMTVVMILVYIVNLQF